MQNKHSVGFRFFFHLGSCFSSRYVKSGFPKERRGCEFESPRELMFHSGFCHTLTSFKNPALKLPFSTCPLLAAFNSVVVDKTLCLTGVFEMVLIIVCLSNGPLGEVIDQSPFANMATLTAPLKLIWKYCTVLSMDQLMY